MSHELCELGVIGLTPLGQSLAAHHASNKTRVCISDKDPTFVPQVIHEYTAQMEAGEDDADPPPRASRCMLPSHDMGDIVERLTLPRKIIVFGTHDDDKRFEEIWRELQPALDGGDMILRWGKEDDDDDSMQFYKDSLVSRLARAQGTERAVHLVEMVRLERDRTVVFEGETLEGFLLGGPKAACDRLARYVAPCAFVVHAGNDAGCAHYAHMIQRAVENGVTQALAEGCDVLGRAARFEEQEIGKILNNWHAGDGRLASYLVRITAKIWQKRDHLTKCGFVINHIADAVDLSAADTWVTLEATRLGVPTPTVNATLESRFLSVMRDERAAASALLQVPAGTDTPSVMKDQISDDLEGALYCACVCLVAECLTVFQAASRAEGWDADVAACLRLWNQPGSLLESNLLTTVHAALESQVEDDVPLSLLTVPAIAAELQERHMSWRRIVTLSFASAIPCPALSSSLTLYDSYRARLLPTSLIRAQRDFFDASGYSRVDQEGWFTTCWTSEHTKQRKKKELAMAYAEEDPAMTKKQKTEAT